MWIVFGIWYILVGIVIGIAVYNSIQYFVYAKIISIIIGLTWAISVPLLFIYKLLIDLLYTGW